RIDNDFTGRTAEQHLQPVQNVSAQDAFGADEVRLESAGIFLAINLDPDAKEERWRSSAGDAAHPARPAAGRVELEPLTVRPRQCGGVCSRVGNDAIQPDPG